MSFISTAHGRKSKKFFSPACSRNSPAALPSATRRYSTAGDKALLNAQPIMIDCNKGKVALGHNGNLTNAPNGAASLNIADRFPDQQRHRSHRAPDRALGKPATFPARWRCPQSSRRRIFTGVMLTQDELYAVRDPRGFRPLVSES